MTPIPDTQDNYNTVVSLLHTALYDQDGESIEGAFVDHWVSNASVALDELAEQFTTQGIAPAILAWLRAAMRAADTPQDALERMLHFLGRSFTPVREMVRAMLQDPIPEARAAAVRASATLFEMSLLQKMLFDPSPLVRVAVVSNLRDAQPLFRRALNDPDPAVRAAAVRQVRFNSTPEGSDALASLYSTEPDTHVRATILTTVAEETRRAAISNGLPDRPTVRERMGEPLVRVMMDGLAHKDSTVRQRVADALRQVHGTDVARALLAQLRVELDPAVRRMLVRWPNRNFYSVPQEAVPLFAVLLAHDSDNSLRIAIADQMTSLGPTAAPPLLAALDDPSTNIREAAARALQGAGTLAHLPNLLQHLALATYPPLYNALNQAIQMIVQRARMHPPDPSPDRSAVVQSLINELDPDPVSQWHVRFCKETLNALPLYGTRALYLWALRPDGEVLVIDMDSASMHTEIEMDVLARFAAILYGAYRYPELRDLIPVPPLQTNPLHYLPRDENPPQ